MTTGERISILRESRDVLQKDLAKAIRVDPVVLNRIEKGKRSARDEELRAIADYFNVSADYLLGRDATKISSLSEEQKTALKAYDELNSEGRRDFWSYLEFLKYKYTPAIVLGANFNTNITVK